MGLHRQRFKREIRDVIRATHAAEEQEEYKPATILGKMSKKEKDKLISQYGKRNEGSSQSA